MDDAHTVQTESETVEPMSMFQFVGAVGTMILALPAIIGA